MSDSTDNITPINMMEENNNNNKKDNSDNSYLYKDIDKLDKEIFFSSSTAKVKTSTILKKQLENQMIPIYQKINGAISEGRYYLKNIELSEDQFKFLKVKGFVISYGGTGWKGDYKYYTNCTIKWE